MWHILGPCVRERHNVNNVADLSRLRQQDWNQITTRKLQKLIRSITVVAADEGHTKY
jgi:hypothetical protein